MNLIDKKVMHNNFGKGNVVACSDSIIEIDFSTVSKKFMFPDSFGEYLFLLDRESAHLVAEIKQEMKEERKQQELELEEEKAIQQKKHEQLRLHEKFLNDSKISPRSQVVFWCKEEELDTIFSEWKVFTGVVKSGASKGMPNKLSRLHQNSACLLTTREEDQPEKSRTILGLYMINENFIGKLGEDGYIPAHSTYKLRLSPEESQKMLFWNYYINEKFPQNMTWNTGRYRYFDNIWMAQILRDILALRKGSQEEDSIQAFYDYFCELNQIEKDQLPRSNGSLSQG